MDKILFIKEELSKQLCNIQDKALEDVLRKILFSQDQDWNKIFVTMTECFPEIKQKYNYKNSKH